MMNKPQFVFLLLGWLCVQHARGRVARDTAAASARPPMDDLDTTTVQKTGCKFLSLGKDEVAMFTRGANLSHTTLAALSNSPEPDLRQRNFELHFAVRADSHLHVALFSRRRYVNSQQDPDFTIGIESSEYNTTFFQYHIAHDSDYRGGYRTFGPLDLLSSDKYVNFYIKLDYSDLFFGVQCQSSSFDLLKRLKEEFVQFGFVAKSESGAKVLYDCPSNFADCPCNWRD